MPLECLVIADDLTGACDAAVQFVSGGRRVVVSLDPANPPEADVLAITTESRDAEMASFRTALSGLPALRPRIVFKKIDSTLRGNVGPEVAATMEAFGFDCAVVTPAFPAMGRVVEGGYLHVRGENGFVPKHLGTCFRDLPGQFHLRDATCDADLDAIVAESHTSVLWAGSAGLAAALARSLGSFHRQALTFSPADPLFCLGSDHPVTTLQQARLIEARGVAAGLVHRIPRGGPIDLDAIRAPLVLSGGDTASLVCRALQVRAIRLLQEISPGIPCGVLIGGPLDGQPVVTKSGGFGGPDALIEIADFFTCSPPSH